MKDLVVLAADNDIKHALKGLIVSRVAPVLTEASVVFAGTAHMRPARFALLVGLAMLLTRGKRGSSC